MLVRISVRTGGHILLTALAGAACACHTSRDASKPVVVLTYQSPMWYEETGRYFQVSRDGRRAIYGSAPRIRLYDLSSGGATTDARTGPLDRLRAAAFDSTGALVDVQGPLPRWSPDGSRVAYFTPGRATVNVGGGATPTVVTLDGAVNGLEWTPSGDALYAIVLHPTGLSSLVRISSDGAAAVVRADLDASPFFNSLAFAPDGATLFLALAGDAAPDPKTRHDPEAPHRDLDIYALDLRRGGLRAIVRAPGDDCCPFVANGALYWTHNDPNPEVVVFPIDGGDPRAVADHGFLPRWSPQGRQIAFTRAYYRLADYGLDMDGWIVGVDANGGVTSAPKAWITGFGEDMGPVWSPDGRWVAYHSHRSATPVPLYESPGRTDDTWLMSSSGGPEIRLTDFGFEVGPPDWAPDSRRIIFDSWEKDGVPRFAKPWITTIDPATGRALGSTRMPLPPGVAGITGEAWSPRGDQIAFVERIDDVKRALWVSGPDGSAARRLTQFSCYTIGGVAWTPDAQTILYGALADDRMQIFAIPLAGDSPRQLTRGDVNMMHPSVSPDGRFVAASRIPWRKQLWRMQLAF